MMNTETKPGARILVIDDEPFFLELLSEALTPHFNVSLAKNGKQGIKLVNGSAPPDLILLDISMPEMDGYETCRQLKSNPETCEIPVIFLTAKQQPEDELKGFRAGALDYITKPISIPVLLARVSTQLTAAEQRIALEQLVQERTDELERTKDAIVYSMGEMAEMRDKETGEHLIRTRDYVGLLARNLALLPRYKNTLTPRLIKAFERAAPLHDIGKVATPDKILLKPGKLTPEEWEIMKLHPMHGKQTIESAEKKIGSTLFIQVAKDIAYSHHEKWDGSGYPLGLKNEEIPLSARLMALADVYDALTTERPYKQVYDHESASEIIVQQRAKHFDPLIINSFEQVNQDFKLISSKNNALRRIE
jgi:putative two-component system response regulator